MSILWLDDYAIKPPKNHIKAAPHKRIDWTVAVAWLGCALISLLTLSGLIHLVRIVAGAL
jgi:hypothetical protein